MPERTNTGGAKEFSYTKEDLQRIRSTDTQSTKAFKEAYRGWQAKREEEKLASALRKQRMILIGIAVLLVVAAVLLFLLL